MNFDTDLYSREVGIDLEFDLNNSCRKNCTFNRRVPKGNET